jgi:hypothetical protein
MTEAGSQRQNVPNLLNRLFHVPKKETQEAAQYELVARCPFENLERRKSDDDSGCAVFSPNE